MWCVVLPSSCLRMLHSSPVLVTAQPSESAAEPLWQAHLAGAAPKRSGGGCG